ncbi:acyclic terpene utilization AtuA family protein [Egicoccus sp. AB-alg6-2]|uniref:acyclic terpene utilization AtuA family protein n=1 Tax=Egicoccus sp. AB-alg6-2 TaxID=3242692 RepID=UPI00359EE534
MDAPLRIANCSGFYGDRHAAAAEQLEGGPIDVLTGDYLAELTMLVLWRTRQKSGVGYARTFLRQMRDVLAPCVERGTAVVVNAGGLDPAGLAGALRELAAALRLDVAVAHVEGDDLYPRLDGLRAAGHHLVNLDTGQPLDRLCGPVVSANAYLGGWGIAAALREGAQVVVTGRVSDASLVVGPAAAHFGWQRTDWDALAGAVVAGHAIECGTQATGGNYPFFTEIPGIEHPGFPIAEVHADGSSVVTKHPGTGGRVDVSTVTAQLLYEIGAPGYLNPDVTAHFDTITLQQQAADRVRIHGVRGTPPPSTSKVSLNAVGGHRNRVTFVLTGLEIEAKADLVRRQLEPALEAAGPELVDWRLVRGDHADAEDNAAATATLTLTVHHPRPEPIGRALASACVELALASYPGFTVTAPPTDAEPFGRSWPATVPSHLVEEAVVLPDGRRIEIRQTGADHGRDGAADPPAGGGGHAAGGDRPDHADHATHRLPLGHLAGARSGDKGGTANVGFWVRDPDHYAWLLGVVGTVDAVRALLPEAADLPVEVHHLPNLRAVNVVLPGLLGDGVASSTRPDPQAKGLGEYLRSRLVPVPLRLLGGEATAPQDVAR